jgi:hypothetical protein
VATVTKTWSWASGAESWTAATYSGSFSAIGYNGSNGDPASGCLEFAATSLATHVGELYIQGTWEDFGVPSGSVISAVRLTGLQSKCHAFTNGSVALAALYVTRTTNETEATVWGGRSASGVESSWVSSSGSSVSIPSVINASSTAVRVKMTAEIDMGFPSALHGIYFDTLSLEITYDAAAKTASDTGTVTEGATIVATLAASDAGTTTDSSSPARTEYLRASDSGTLGDAAGVEIDGTVYNVVSDSATVTDSASVTASVGVTEAPSVTDGTPALDVEVGTGDEPALSDVWTARTASDNKIALDLSDAFTMTETGAEYAEVRVSGGGSDGTLVGRKALRHGFGCGCCNPCGPPYYVPPGDLTMEVEQYDTGCLTTTTYTYTLKQVNPTLWRTQGSCSGYSVTWTPRFAQYAQAYFFESNFGGSLKRIYMGTAPAASYPLMDAAFACNGNLTLKWYPYCSDENAVQTPANPQTGLGVRLAIGGPKTYTASPDPFLLKYQIGWNTTSYTRPYTWFRYWTPPGFYGNPSGFWTEGFYDTSNVSVIGFGTPCRFDFAGWGGALNKRLGIYEIRIFQ